VRWGWNAGGRVQEAHGTAHMCVVGWTACTQTIVGVVDGRGGMLWDTHANSIHSPGQNAGSIFQGVVQAW